MSKRIVPIILIVFVLSLGFGIFIPRPTQEVCTSGIDCGFDVGRTDFMDVKNYGYPFIAERTETTRQYDDTSLDVITTTRSNYHVVAIVLNILSWSALTLALFLIIGFRIKRENHRH